jgi:hypothetical protein
MRPLLRPLPLLALWTVLCLILMIVGFATLVSQPSGNGDLLQAASSPELSYGAVAGIAAALWLLCSLLLLVGVAVRRLCGCRGLALGSISPVIFLKLRTPAVDTGRRAGDSHAKEASLCLPRCQLEEEP